MPTFADKVITYNNQLHFTGKLPKGISIMNPFKDKVANSIATCFYKKYYNDNNPRYLILGINPGRFGGGITGVPFTDPKRLIEKCGIEYKGDLKHEPSSVFIYEMIDAFGGVEKFYKKLYIHSMCPLGFTINKEGKEVNYNYYDSKELTNAVYNFMIENIRNLIALGVHTDVCFCFGTGKNEQFLRKVNEEHKFFGKIVAVEHPRFIMQYKTKSKQTYIDKYISAFNSTGN